MGRDAVHRDPLQPGRRADTRYRLESGRPAVTRKAEGKRQKAGQTAAPTVAIAGALLPLVLVLLTAARPAAHDPITTKVTFAREIRAILSTHCTVCHARGGSAPMPLTTYEETRPWARAIKEQTLTRRMPKWHAARGYGAFSNDSTLTPFELSLIVSWVDGGLPEGPKGATAAVSARTPGGAGAAGGAGGADGAPPEETLSVVVPARGERGAVHGEPQWVTAWTFEPGDPLITDAAISSDAGTIGTWVAGDNEVRLPSGSAMRLSGWVRVAVRRRPATDFERPFTPKRSVLTLTTQQTRPSRRAWTEQASCGAARTGRPAELLAVRPILDEGGSARLWIERAGAPRNVLGWFRDFDARFARAYWLARAADFPVDARLLSDAPCQLQLTLITQR